MPGIVLRVGDSVGEMTSIYYLGFRSLEFAKGGITLTTDN